MTKKKKKKDHDQIYDQKKKKDHDQGHDQKKKKDHDQTMTKKKKKKNFTQFLSHAFDGGILRVVFFWDRLNVHTFDSRHRADRRVEGWLRRDGFKSWFH
jgi:hypothetical protein